MDLINAFDSPQQYILYLFQLFQLLFTEVLAAVELLISSLELLSELFDSISILLPSSVLILSMLLARTS